MMVLAQEDLSVLDNDWPQTFIFPFGEWLKQLIFWAVNNPVTAFIGDVVEWPFTTFFDLIMSEQVGRDSIMTIPWVWMVVAVFVIASFTRNARIGLACAAMLSICGFLGATYWTETAKTIGMIVVSVTLCAIVGIPLGILSGRFDAIWNVVRPTLDGMQVIHSFVFMLPFIFFFSIGEVSATMVTMVFALPPIVRLTNLGIRQVPEDVVEAARSYGATELRVLTDVQIPLARPAIMTGLNQTLLLAISMLGIAAIMGAGGLGKLLFRAINNNDLGLAASAGLAFFLVAVILDRISQTEEQDGVSLLSKVRQAWAYRADPEGLLEQLDANAIDPASDANEPAERPAPVSSTERTGLLVGLVGGILGIASIFLTWSSNAGGVSSWGRFADESLEGLSFNGFQASGGSFFGVMAGFFALAIVLAAVRPLLSFGEGISRNLLKVQGALLAGLAGLIGVIWILNLLDVGFGPLPTLGLTIFGVLVFLVVAEVFVTGAPRLGADGVLLAGFGLAAASISFLVLRQSEWTTQAYSDGIGVYIAAIGGILALVGGVMATSAAPFGPRKPLPASASYGKIIGSVVALLLVVGSAFGVGDIEKKTEYGWYFDSRIEAIERASDEVPADVQLEIERIEAEAGDDITKQIVAAQEITNLLNTIKTGSRVVYTGVAADGPGLGWLSIALAALGVAASVLASGAASLDERRRWFGSVMMAGFGMALMVVPMAFTLGIVRVATGANPLAGIGAFMTFVAGAVIFSGGRGVLGEFRRNKIYAEVTITDVRAETVLGVGAEAAQDEQDLLVT